jgi:hypothetical protein
MHRFYDKSSGYILPVLRTVTHGLSLATCPKLNETRSGKSATTAMIYHSGMRIQTNAEAKVNQPSDTREGLNVADSRPMRWPVYHGTSTRRLKRILSEKRLRVSATGDRKVALTTERSVAEYWACTAVVGDKHDHSDADSQPVVLTLDGEGLVALHYELEGHSDPVWGDGACDWENEVACRSDIELDDLDDLLISVELVPQDRRDAYDTLESIEQRSAQFKPTGPRLADHELAIMEYVVDGLEEGEITRTQANAIIVAMRSLRRSLRSAAADD